MQLLPHYDPRTASYLCFADARAGFASGSDTPRAYLERCINQIGALEPQVRAFVTIDADGARAAADASTERWRRREPRSVVDGLPFGVKDCYDVAGLPTRVNSDLFPGHRAAIDAAHVDALRRNGAVFVGKTVTTELTMAAPGPTWNPWDLTRTPGGSSSGSAAAVAARMLPLATGSQVRGSIVRPASICGVIGFKPSYGALNRNGGFDPSPSLNHLGFLGGTLVDVWETARVIAREAGGDPGCLALEGSDTLPKARAPHRLARQYTSGWQHTDAASQAAFDAFLRELARQGVEIVEPEASDELRAYEDATARVPEFFFDLMLWETRWPMRALRDAHPSAISETVAGYIAAAERLTPADYRHAHQRREELRERHRALCGKVDAFITLAHIGPGQLGQPKVGTPWYNDASSAIGAPAYGLPLLAVDRLPVGVQIVGFESEDEDLTRLANWLMRELQRS